MAATTNEINGRQDYFQLLKLEKTLYFKNIYYYFRSPFFYSCFDRCILMITYFIILQGVALHMKVGLSYSLAFGTTVLYFVPIFTVFCLPSSSASFKKIIFTVPMVFTNTGAWVPYFI